MGHGGRPTKFSPELGTRIIDLLRTGMYVETVSAAVGLHKDTLYRWLKRGARAKTGALREFSDAFQKAVIEQEQRALIGIQLHGKREWTALAWFLERRFPDRWGRRRVELTGPDGGPMRTESQVKVYLPENHRDRG